MKWQRPIGIIVIGACVALILLGIYGMVTWIITQKNGKEVWVTIKAVPQTCGRYNSMKVELDGVTHWVNISRAACRKGTYKPGQQIRMMQHPRYKELVWPGSRPDLVILCILGVCLLIFIQFKTQKR